MTATAPLTTAATPIRADAATAPAGGSRVLSRLLQGWVPGVAVAIGFLLIVGPVAATLLRSVITSDIALTVPSLANFAKLVHNRAMAEATANTLMTGIGVTLASALLGCTLAWIVVRTDIGGRRWFEVLNLVPFFLSPYVGAMSWLYLAAPNAGIVQKLLKPYAPHALDWLNLYSIPGVIWVLSLFYTPYIYLFVIGPMRSMDGALEDAARVHGARFWYTVRAITLPLILPSLLSGALIVLVTSAGLFDVPLALASPRAIHTIPTDIYAAVQYPTDFGYAAALGTLTMLATVLCSLFQQRYVRSRRFDTVSGKGYRPRPVRLGPAGRVGAYTVEILYLAMGVALPLTALIMVSLSSLWTGTFNPSRITFANFRYVWFNYSLTQSALQNSLFLAAIGATIGVTLGLLQAYFVRRRGGRVARFVEPMLSLPLGIPGIIIGLGFLILLIRTPLYSTIWILLIAYVAHFFPFALRSISAMLLSLNPELEQSARASGATWLQTMRYIVLPLLRPAITAAWLMLFVIFVRELGASILLYAQGTETISVVLVVLSERNFGYVAALAVTQLILLLGAFVFFARKGASILER
ncbi:MAG TPA: iron ABC transporter permease [Stellaceae bacterium]|jgi:iron(III) transport system permease protein|nr:iron ABC transporter permease [Stellaceae bacterium]